MEHLQSLPTFNLIFGSVCVLILIGLLHKMASISWVLWVADNRWVKVDSDTLEYEPLTYERKGADIKALYNHRYGLVWRIIKDGVEVGGEYDNFYDAVRAAEKLI